MPNKFTFQIEPIAELIKAEMVGTGLVWVDPFSGMNKLAKYTNDLNPEMPSQWHQDALEWLELSPTNSADGVFYDPPYTVRQLSECYKSVGLATTMELTSCSYFAKVKDQIARIVKPGGKVLSFGYDTNGMGKNRGFEWINGLKVHHGGCHHDTDVTVERKVNGSLIIEPSVEVAEVVEGSRIVNADIVQGHG